MLENSPAHTHNVSRKYISSNYWFRFLVIIILVLGLFFRFANLDKKPVWGDESHTFSVISGYTYGEVIKGLPTGTPISITNFFEYQYPNPIKGLEDVLKNLYTDVHPPIYFLLARSWVDWFGHSVASLRSFSAFTSLLALPCMYWLCIELFRTPAVGWMATVLLAVSPINVIYASEARPYSLLSLTVLLSGASLLWALRTQKKLAWLIYAICLILGFYSQLFFLFVAGGYAAYVAAIEGFKFTKRFMVFLIATSASFLTFVPWIFTIYMNLSEFKEKSAWISQQKLTFLGAIRWLSHNISLPFIDPGASSYFGLHRFSLYFLIPFSLGLVGYSIYFLCRKTSKQVYLFIFTLIGSTALPLILADLILGGNRQTWPRYLFPCFLGIQISVAYLLSSKITPMLAQKIWQQRLYLVVTAVVITSGIVFCTIFSQADTWWNKYTGELIVQVSRAINHSNQPVLIVNRQSPGTIFYYSLDPKVKLLILENEDFSIYNLDLRDDIFLMNPTEKLKFKLAHQNYDLELITQYLYTGAATGQHMELWKIRGNNRNEIKGNLENLL